MKIAFCHYYGLSFGGGGERFLVDAARWLVEKGHEVSIYSVPIRRGLWRPSLVGFEYREAPIHSFSAEVAYYLYNPLIAHLFRYRGPRIAGIHSPLLTQSLAETGYSSRSLTDDVRSHGMLAAFMKHSTRAIQAKELSTFDAVDWVSPSEPNEIHHRRLFKTPGWVNTRTFYPKAEKDKEFTVLFVGRHDYGKGFDRFLELSQVLTNLRFVSTGESVGRIQGLGHLSDEDLATLYSRSSVLVCPSRGDTFGRVLPESLACGTPVLTTSIPAHTSLGLPLGLADNTGDMTNALTAIYEMWKNEKSEYEKVALAGLQSVKKYDIDNILPRFEMMLEQVGSEERGFVGT
jgi:glycosyltransferase involved in cell wall biosynthesis